MYIATLTAEEVSYSGVRTREYTSYLLNEQYIPFWLLSPYCFNCYSDVVSGMAYDLNQYGGLGYWYSKNSNNARPAIQLLNGTEISGGNGTQSNPYVIE